MKSLILIISALIFSSVSLAGESEGGGSSTGGGHVRVCLTAGAAKKAKKNIRLSTETPQIGLDPFTGIDQDDILSVELLDLVEQPGLLARLMPRLKQVADNASFNDTRDLTSIEMLKTGADIVVRRLRWIGSAFAPETNSEILSYVNDVLTTYEWNPTKTGLYLTSDFDPKVTNPANCVFAQAVRQEFFSESFSTLDYDERLLNKMSAEHLIALGIHEAVYNIILNSKNRAKISNTSVKARQLTILLLSTNFDSLKKENPTAAALAISNLARLLESLGYGPYSDMVIPEQRLSRTDRNAYEIEKWLKECEADMIRQGQTKEQCEPFASDGFELIEEDAPSTTVWESPEAIANRAAKQKAKAKEQRRINRRK